MWINEPSGWTADGDALTFSVTGETDLWRQTHYGYTYDTAPMYGRTVEGDATVRVTFTGQYAEQYDQAGAILRADENNWIKAGVGSSSTAPAADQRRRRPADFSDWSVMRAPEGTTSVTFELVREGDSVHINWGVDGGAPTPSSGSPTSRRAACPWPARWRRPRSARGSRWTSPRSSSPADSRS